MAKPADWGKFHSAPELIELLETYLEIAKGLPFGHASICMVGHPNVCASDYAGDISLEKSQDEALQILRARLNVSIDAWTLPPRDESLDASHAVYNLANGPLGFDFVVWLVDAEMTRIRAGAPAPLKVAFWLGKDAAQRINQDKRRMWLDNVFRPALNLIGAVEDSTAVHGHHKPIFVTKDIVKAFKAGESVPRFRSPPHLSLDNPLYAGLTPDPFVTITLREAEHWPERNSNPCEWAAFADYLRQQGERVIFIRDTARSEEQFLDFETLPRASRNLLYRMAIYERAKCNFFTSNGPSVLALFSDRPWIQFIKVTDQVDPYKPNTAQFWSELQGVNPGEQYPWSAPDQRIVWKPETHQNMISAWNEYIQTAAKAA